MFKNKRNFTKNKFFIDNFKFVCYIGKKTKRGKGYEHISSQKTRYESNVACTV